MPIMSAWARSCQRPPRSRVSSSRTSSQTCSVSRITPSRSNTTASITARGGRCSRGRRARRPSPVATRPIIGCGLLASDRMGRRELAEIAIDGALVAAAALAHFLDVTPVLQFILAALAIAGLARLVGSSTEQLGGRVGAAGAGVIQSALGNLPELFIALFALHDGLVKLVQAALIGSVLANSVLVLGLAFTVGGLRNGTQSFDSPRARMLATLTVLAAAILSMPSLANAFHAPAAAHGRTLSLLCAGVLLAVFVLTLPGLLAPLPNEAEHERPRWSLRTTLAVLLGAAIAAAGGSDWVASAP